MSPVRKAALKASAASLQNRADRAFQFLAVRLALLSEQIKMLPHPDFAQFIKDKFSVGHINMLSDPNADSVISDEADEDDEA
jgi:hypothetical protein